MDIGTTYGVPIQSVVSEGPADKAGTQQATIEGNDLLLGGDVITAINCTHILNGDALSTCLERNALPGQTIAMTILRNGQTMNLSVTLGTRPAPGS